MRLGNGPSWRIAIDEPSDLHQVLFVRDACHLPQEVDSTGRLNPDAPDLSNLVPEHARLTAATAWSGWWGQALSNHRSIPRMLPDGATNDERFANLRRRAAAADSPEFASLADAPELQTAARNSFSSFHNWWTPRRTRMPATGFPPTFPGAQGHLIGLHRGDDIVGEAVRTVEQELGREAKPFELSIEVLAVHQPLVIAREARYALIAAIR